MRAPQFGHSKRKRRGGTDGWSKPLTKKLPVAAELRPFRAVGLHGINQPMPTRRIRYIQPREAQYEDGTLGAKVTLTLHRVRLDRNGVPLNKGGPIVTKQYHSKGNSL